MPRRCSRLVCAAILLILPVGQILAASADEPLRVRYPEYVGDDPVYTRLVNYSVDLLDLALSKTDQAYRLEPVPGEFVTDRRAVRLLDDGIYDVNWMHTNALRETALQAVYFPMFKGLAGWRLLMIDAASADKFNAQLSAAGLQNMRVGLGHDWPDVEHMKSNGYTVVTAINRDNLINMMLSGRLDYMSRSVFEIWDELAYYQDKPLAVACCIALQYPSAFYFFTSRNNPGLSELIMQGLNAALDDGSFQALIDRYYGDVLTKADFANRRVFRLRNSSMSVHTPLARKELWYQP